MTDHQKARRARKSKAFFARLAERAAVQGDKAEALRLLTAARRKATVQALAKAVEASKGDPRDAIVSRVYAALTTDKREAVALPDGTGGVTPAHPGEILTMGDGSRWFHPYKGGAPLRLADVLKEA